MSRNIKHDAPWTTTMDELLLSGISKYGLQHWEKIASLLQNKKTAAQCRARFEHYLDPRLNLKTPFSYEEEVCLLETFAIFPNQWNIIAEQINALQNNNNNNNNNVGYVRPAWLCEETYKKLKMELDYKNSEDRQNLTLEEYIQEKQQQAQQQVLSTTFEEKAAVQKSSSNFQHNANSDDETLQLAISRLANQDQKKGLRKERNNKLKEANFLAKLEANREAMDSGTLSEKQKKKYAKALMEDERTLSLQNNNHDE
ncbi:Myb-like DNA-binding domain containing protein, putative [Angomonas deanei]|uniref:Myb-like DNA-binding domain containing protein, putative n=1 Tax=Angomonas deanei TaxID=59799 RepID=A0A7G2CPB1_9TRYP|nr:Myb-like DNA-binding domain containing protein, putative [Angomonas deanei]